MWPFKKNHSSKTLYKVSYVSGAFIDGNKVTFDLKNLQDIYVEAKNSADAQAAFAKMTLLTSHVYIHSIDKVYTIET